MSVDDLAPQMDNDRWPTEPEEDYVRRISGALPNLPADVIGQWLYEHWDDADNYRHVLGGWARLSVALESAPTAEMQGTHLGNDHYIRGVQPFFENGGDDERYRRIKTFFQEHGTWPRPVIFLHNDPPSSTCSDPTCWGRPLHLVQGHHRMAAFLLYRETGRPLAERHKFWLLRLSDA